MTYLMFSHLCLNGAVFVIFRLPAICFALLCYRTRNEMEDMSCANVGNA